MVEVSARRPEPWQLGQVAVGVVADDRLEEPEVEDVGVHPVVLLDRHRGVEHGEQTERETCLPERRTVRPVVDRPRIMQIPITPTALGPAMIQSRVRASSRPPVGDTS